MPVSLSVQKAIINDNLTAVENTIYDCSIKIRVAEKIGDKDSKKRHVENMEKLEKSLDEYKVILAEIENVPEQK